MLTIFNVQVPSLPTSYTGVHWLSGNWRVFSDQVIELGTGEEWGQGGSFYNFLLLDKILAKGWINDNGMHRFAPHKNKSAVAVFDSSFFFIWFKPNGIS